MVHRCARLLQFSGKLQLEHYPILLATAERMGACGVASSDGIGGKMALFTERKTSTPLLRVRDGRRGQPRPIAPSGVGRALQGRSEAGHYTNAKLSRAPTEFVHKPLLNIVDDFPEAMPVLQRELDIIETYLGATLDQLLGQFE
jgi:hypothetical protein